MDIQIIGNVLLAIAILVVVAYRQTTWRPAVPAVLWRAPLIMGVVGVFLLVQQHTFLTGLDAAVLVIELVVSLGVDVPDAAVLVLTTYADDESILAALRAGAKGYLTKDAGRAELAAAVRSVARGQAILGAEARELVIGALTAPAREATSADAVSRRFPALTAREAEVLALAADGLGNREIAARLYIGVSTVKTHVNAIFAKLGVRTRDDAVARVRDGGD
jgi:DNA-binding NarL/FixJ family response regulator